MFNDSFSQCFRHPLIKGQQQLAGGRVDVDRSDCSARLISVDRDKGTDSVKQVGNTLYPFQFFHRCKRFVTGPIRLFAAEIPVRFGTARFGCLLFINPVRNGIKRVEWKFQLFEQPQRNIPIGIVVSPVGKGYRVQVQFTVFLFNTDSELPLLFIKDQRFGPVIRKSAV